MNEQFWKISPLDIENGRFYLVHTSSNMCRQYLAPQGKIVKDFFKAEFFKTEQAAEVALEEIYEREPVKI